VRDSEQVLLSHLTETASLDILAAEGFGTDESCEVLSAELSRLIVQWALTVYFESGRAVPITKLMIEETWGDELERLSITIDDEHELEPIEWAIDDLRAAYASKVAHDFATRLAIAVGEEAHAPERVQVLLEHSNELFRLTRSLVSRRQEVDAAQGLEMALQRYIERTQANTTLSGMCFGMPSIDLYTKGTHPGEITVVASPSAVGKSWIALKTAFEEWRRGRRCILFTLENSIEMTADRLACVGAGVSYEQWQVGQCDDRSIERVEKLISELKSSEIRPIFIMPGKGERTMTAMVRKAFTENADSMVIDQLSFVEESTKGAKNRNRWAAFGDMMHELKEAISGEKEKIPCLVLHQIKREGIKEATTTGRFEMSHLAEASEIERTADFIFAIYRSDFDKENDGATWQTLKARRVPPANDFNMIWDLSHGHIAVRGDSSPRRVA
jgi:replicative DNA helicase